MKSEVTELIVSVRKEQRYDDGDHPINVPQNIVPGNWTNASTAKHGKRPLLLEIVIYKGLTGNYLMNQCLIVEAVLNILMVLRLWSQMKPTLNNDEQMPL